MGSMLSLSSYSASSGSKASDNPPSTKQYICYMCSKTFDIIETLDSDKRLKHSKLGQPKSPAGVG